MKLKITFSLLLITVFSGFLLLSSCVGGSGDKTQETATPPAPPPNPMTDKGIGPVTSLQLGAVDNAMAADGQKIFAEKCTSCHNPTKKMLGPAPKGVLDRRTPEWVMNMILNPTEMLDKDPVAMYLLRENNNTAMTNQGLTQDDARKVLEYFRTL